MKNLMKSSIFKALKKIFKSRTALFLFYNFNSVYSLFEKKQTGG
nr:hypothetical protein [Mycoplasmopsis bovis]